MSPSKINKLSLGRLEEQLRKQARVWLGKEALDRTQFTFLIPKTKNTKENNVREEGFTWLIVQPGVARPHGCRQITMVMGSSDRGFLENSSKWRKGHKESGQGKIPSH